MGQLRVFFSADLSPCELCWREKGWEKLYKNILLPRQHTSLQLRGVSREHKSTLIKAISASSYKIVKFIKFKMGQLRAFFSADLSPCELCWREKKVGKH